MNPVEQIIEKSGLTQKEISKRTGIPESSISNAKKRHVIGNIEKAIEIGKSLGMKRFFFFYNGYKVTCENK
jgi:transcriptional regulator with XRE-family HTH domain